MSAAPFQILAQAAPTEDIEDIIELGDGSTAAVPDDLVELKDPPLWSGWYWIGGGAWILAALLLYLLTRKKKAAPVAAEPSTPPHDRALQALRELWTKEADLADKAFATGLSDVLRSYIEEAFALRAPERTTEEFFVEASQHPDLKGDFAARLDEFLSLVDRVKFARMPLAPEKRVELYEASVRFVEESQQAQMLKMAPELSASAQLEQEESA